MGHKKAQQVLSWTSMYIVRVYNNIVALLSEEH